MPRVKKPSVEFPIKVSISFSNDAGVEFGNSYWLTFMPSAALSQMLTDELIATTKAQANLPQKQDKQAELGAP